MLLTNKKLCKFWKLPRDRKALMIRVAFLMPIYWIGLRLFGFAGMVRWTEAAPGSGSLSAIGVRDMAETVSIASRVIMGSENCLVRSLVLRRLLSRRGIRTELKIGVRGSGDRFEAHAWLENNGIPVNDREDIARRFAAFDDPLPLTAFGR